MENKDLISSKKMSQKLIGMWILWGLLFGFIYSFVFSLLTVFINSVIIEAIISIILQGLMAFILWKLSTTSAFKNNTVSIDDVPTIIRNLVIFTIIICILNGVYNISQVNSSIDEIINNDYQLKISESYMKILYNTEELTEYNIQKEKSIKEAKKQAYTYLIILNIGLTVVYLAVLPLE